MKKIIIVSLIYLFTGDFTSAQDCSTHNIIPSTYAVCVGSTVTFNLYTTTTTPPPEIQSGDWNFGDGITLANASGPQHVYTSAGSYVVTCRPVAVECIETITITVNECSETGCKDCIGSFAPVPGQKYVISAWVKQSASENEITYLDPAITLEFVSVPAAVPPILGPFKGKAQIIDGWQRIEEEFVVPAGSTKITINLENVGTATREVFFDDVRIHPFNSNLKSFVYDPITLRLAAELDANNYATFYEYDEDGALVRVKKETEKGISTIKETRNNNKK